MAYIIGPTTTLPGSMHYSPPGTMCDNHPQRPASARIQGETDSMGSELIDCCRECAEVIRSQAQVHANGKCDWCEQFKDRLRPYRDRDEGAAGPVYDVCDACIQNSVQAAAEEVGDDLPEQQYDDFEEDDAEKDQPTDFAPL